jgi:c-di-GMP-binding flagellar brake protein YcgR
MQVRIYDLSLGGCLIQAACELEVGRRIALHLDLPGEGRISVEGETVRVLENSRFALRFIDVAETDRERLERGIERLLERSAQHAQNVRGSSPS